jgi:hypothetical protein
VVGSSHVWRIYRRDLAQMDGKIPRRDAREVLLQLM